MRGSLQIMIALALSAGCSALVGIEDWSPDSSGGSTIAAASGGGGGSTSSSALGGGGSEDCVDGICTPDVPGWDGPVQLALGARGSAPLDCPRGPASLVVSGPSDPTVPPATCTCACKSPSGGKCASPSATTYADGGCSLGAAPIGYDPSCIKFSSFTIGSVQGSAGPPSGSVCMPMNTTKVLDPITFAHTATVCGGAAGACSGGSCVAAPLAPFLGPCVYASGDLGCPVGYDDRHLVTEGLEIDGRDCDACTCGAVTLETCAGSLFFYGDTACLNQAGPAATLDGNCSVDSLTAASANFAVSPIGGMCASGGGAPIGAATFKAPTTVCCVSAQ